MLTSRAGGFAQIEIAMNPDEMGALLKNPEAATDWLRSIGLTDLPRADANLIAIQNAGLPLDLLTVIAQSPERLLAAQQ